MFFVSIIRPNLEDEKRVCEKGQRLGLNYKCPGSSENAPPLPEKAKEDGWWAVDHERVKIGYGKKTYESSKKLLNSWGQFQLPWAQVQPNTPIKPGAAVCVTANVFGLWTAVPLQLLYKTDGKRTVAADVLQKKRKHNVQRMSYGHGCLKTHFLAGEERFGVEWDQSDDSVWYDIYTFSRPDHPLAMIGYPVVRFLQWRFRQDSLRAVARATALDVVGRSLDLSVKNRLIAAEEKDGKDALSR